MNDLHIIKQIENIFNIKLVKEKEIGVLSRGYTINLNGQIIGIGLYNCEIEKIEKVEKKDDEPTSVPFRPMGADIAWQEEPLASDEPVFYEEPV